MESVLAALRDLDGQVGVLAERLGPGFVWLLFAYGLFQTGWVLGPLIPGNAVVFAVGVLTAGIGAVEPLPAVAAMATGVALGHFVNYGQGYALGRRLFLVDKAFLTQKNLRHTEDFFARHGRRAMLVAPFIPFVRSFAPFVAGVARMPLGALAVSGTVGALVWIGSLFALGYLFGNLPGVRENIGLVVIGISLLVMAKIGTDVWKRRAVPENRRAPS